MFSTKFRYAAEISWNLPSVETSLIFWRSEGQIMDYKKRFPLWNATLGKLSKEMFGHVVKKKLGYLQLFKSEHIRFLQSKENGSFRLLPF